jgi:hypothetical protein
VQVQAQPQPQPQPQPENRMSARGWEREGARGRSTQAVVARGGGTCLQFLGGLVIKSGLDRRADRSLLCLPAGGKHVRLD